MNTTRSQLHGPTDFNGKKALVNWPSVAVYASMETWPSGRRRSPAKGVGEESSRGFESLRLRHTDFFKQNQLVRMTLRGYSLL